MNHEDTKTRRRSFRARRSEIFRPACPSYLRGSKRSFLLTDLVARQVLQHLHHAGMIPGGAAMRGGRVEELLAGRRIGQRNMQRAGARQREVEILLMELDAE